MALVWGPWTTGTTNNFRVGIDLEYNESNLLARYEYFIECETTTNAAMTLVRSGRITGNVSFTGASPIAKSIGSGTFNTNRGETHTLTATITGTPSGATPSVTSSIFIVPIAPTAPSGPPILLENTSDPQRQVFQTPPPGNTGGGEIYGYNWPISFNAEFTQLTTIATTNDVILTWPLRRGTTYWIRCQARASYGTSPYGPALQFTVPAYTPRLEKAPVIVILSSNVVRLDTGGTNDDGGSPILERQVQVATDRNFTDLVHTGTLNPNVNINVQPATSFFARTRARNAVGWGTWGDALPFTTNAMPPSNPSRPEVTEVRATGATVSWGAPSTNGSQITGYEVDISLNGDWRPGFYTTYAANGTGFSFTNLVPGSVYVVRVRAKNAMGFGNYSGTRQFDTFGGVPTVSSPNGLELGLATGTVVTRRSGRAGARVSSQGYTGPLDVTVQVATNTAFTTGLVEFTGRISGLAGSVDAVSPNLQANGTYYVRARVTHANYQTAWSETYRYQQLHTPQALPMLPQAGSWASAPADEKVQFQWKFLDTALTSDNRMDGQAEYQVRVENNATGALVFQTARVTAPSPTGVVDPVTTVALDMGGQPWPRNTTLRWRVTVWDKSGNQGQSNWTVFNLGNPPVVTPLQPVNATSVGTGTPTFAWSSTIPTGGEQARARVEVYRASDMQLIWSDTVNGKTATITPKNVILQNGVSYVWRVFVYDSKGLEGSASSTMTADFIAPPTVDFVVIMDGDEIGNTGPVRVDWTGSQPDAFHVAWNVYRRKAGDADYELLKTIPDISATYYNDWFADAGTQYQYSVTQVADRSGLVMESPIGYRTAGDLDRITNHVLNPSFEASTGGNYTWTATTDGGSQPDESFTGNRSARLLIGTANTANEMAYYTTESLENGGFFAASVRVLHSAMFPNGTTSPANGARAVVQIQFVNVNNVLMGAMYTGTPVQMTSFDVWFQAYHVVAIPAGALRAIVRLKIYGPNGTSPSANQAYYTDGWMATSDPNASVAEEAVYDYFDGSTREGSFSSIGPNSISVWTPSTTAAPHIVPDPLWVPSVAGTSQIFTRSGTTSVTPMLYLMGSNNAPSGGDPRATHPAFAGTVYEASCSVTVTTSASRMAILWFDANGTLISRTDGVTKAASSQQKGLNVRGVAPEGTRYACPIVEAGGTITILRTPAFREMRRYIGGYTFNWLGYAHSSLSIRRSADYIDTRTWSPRYGHYWLILDDGVDRIGTKLKSVTADSFKDEYETATYNVIGRGRHRAEGTRYGYTGSLTIQLRGEDAGLQRRIIQGLRATQRRLYMRTPFGEYFPIALGDVAVDRLAGVELDMSDISLPYEEVY